MRRFAYPATSFLDVGEGSLRGAVVSLHRTSLGEPEFLVAHVVLDWRLAKPMDCSRRFAVTEPGLTAATEAASVGILLV
jgi:hypothetical protein